MLAGPLATEYGREQPTSSRDFISCSSGPQDLISDHQPLSVYGLPSVLFGCWVGRRLSFPPAGLFYRTSTRGSVWSKGKNADG